MGPPSGSVPPPHLLGTPAPPQTWGDAHAGQLRMPPQPSANGPQSPGAHAAFVGVHVPASIVPSPPPQTLGLPPPPQISGGLHVPHDGIRPPHPSAWAPQFTPGRSAHVFGTHPL